MNFKGFNKLNDHVNHFALRKEGPFGLFWNLAAKNYHSHLEVSIKVEQGQIYPGRCALYYYLEEKDVFKAWEHFKEFLDWMQQDENIVFNKTLLHKIEAALSKLTDTIQFAVGIDLRENISDSRIKFGFVGEAMGPAMELLLTEMEPSRFPIKLLQRVRTGGFDLHFNGQYYLKLYPVFAQHEWSEALEYFEFSEPVINLLRNSSYFFIATHHRNFPVQIELTSEQLNAIIPIKLNPRYSPYNAFVIGLERNITALQSPDTYNLYY